MDNKIIGVFNIKGGSGKTTLALNLATYLKYDLFELQHNYLSALLGNCVLKDIPNKHCIIDFNDETRISFLKKITILLIPSFVDQKDLVCLMASIEKAIHFKVKKIVIILINPYKKDSDFKESKNQFDHFFKQAGYDKENIIIEVIETNKLFESGNFIKHFIGEKFYEYMKEKAFNKYFSKPHRFLELLNQYALYYGLIYDKHNANYKEDMDKISRFKTAENIHMNTFTYPLSNEVLKQLKEPTAKIKDILKNYLTSIYKKQYYLKNGETIDKITNHFISIFPYVSKDKEFLDAIFSFQSYKSRFPASLNELEKASDELFLKKELWFHKNIKKFVNLKVAQDNKFAIQDFIKILDAIDAYFPHKRSSDE